VIGFAVDQTDLTALVARMEHQIAAQAARIARLEAQLAASAPTHGDTEDGPVDGHSRRLLHVGCGKKRLAHLPVYFHSGWTETRLDIDAAVGPDITASITDLSAIPSGSFDALWSSHNIEHLHHHEARVAVSEFRRVLAPAGWVVVTCPDLGATMKHAVDHGLDTPIYESPHGPITPRDILFGHQASIAGGNAFMAHRNGYDLASLGALFSKAGFRKYYAVRQRFSLWIIAGAFETAASAKSLLAEILKSGRTAPETPVPDPAAEEPPSAP
jgi:SAM-dependent methyltransferase